jgi:hypothetical protein
MSRISTSKDDGSDRGGHQADHQAATKAPIISRDCEGVTSDASVILVRLLVLGESSPAPLAEPR